MTKHTAREMHNMVGCSVSYKGTEGTIVGVEKMADWMMRIVLDDGRKVIVRPSELV